MHGIRYRYGARVGWLDGRRGRLDPKRPRDGGRAGVCRAKTSGYMNTMYLLLDGSLVLDSEDSRPLLGDTGSATLAGSLT